jgi:hypothetical protein
MMLIPNWRDAWKFAVTWVASFGGAAWMIWVSLPLETQEVFVGALGLDPGKWMPLIGAIGVIVARITAQPSLHRPDPSPETQPNWKPIQRGDE